MQYIIFDWIPHWKKIEEKKTSTSIKDIDIIRTVGENMENLGCLLDDSTT